MKSVNKFLALLSISGSLIFSVSARAQTSTAAPIAATAPTSVPALVPYSSFAFDGKGKPLTGESTATFLIYKDQQGGEPLFTESQTVAFDETGHYKVHLGASNPSGLPSDLFSSGEARWLEVQIAGQSAEPRILLASVPYALKAADAATLGGLPASAFVLARPTSADLAVNPAVTPVASNVTTPGGVSGYVPEFSGVNSIVDSPLFVSGTSVGVGTTTPTATLDVNGSGLFTGGLAVNGVSTLNGFLLLPALGTATTSTSYNSQYFKLVTSAYNSSTKAIVAPRFQLQAEVAGNDTANPTGTLNLIASSGPGSPTETGFYINANGTIHFAPGQTFPGGTGTGTITGVTAGTALTGGGTTGNVTLNLDTTKIPTLAAHNTFTGINTFNGFANFNDGFTANAPSSIFTTSTGLLVYTTNDGSIYGSLNVPAGGNQYGWAIQGNASNAYSGVYGYGDDKSQAGVIGSGNIGVYAFTDLYGANGGENAAYELTAGVYAQAGTMSNEGASETGTPAAVFADGGATKGSNASVAALVAVTDASNAGLLVNNSLQSTLVLQNAGTGYLLEADGTSGYCEITNAGGLQCNGSITGVNTAADGRTLSTYGVQAAENWYEDYGSGQLQSGTTLVSLDPAFAQTINTTVDYHVFLTPTGDCRGLYVANKTANGFEVRELGGGTTNVGFDYKIVAKRRGYERARLEDITDAVRKQTEERLKRQSAGLRRASHPSIPPVSQGMKSQPVSRP